MISVIETRGIGIVTKIGSVWNARVHGSRSYQPLTRDTGVFDWWGIISIEGIYQEGCWWGIISIEGLYQEG